MGMWLNRVWALEEGMDGSWVHMGPFSLEASQWWSRGWVIGG